METSQIAYAVAPGGADGRTLFAMTAPSSDPGIVDGNRLARIEIARFGRPRPPTILVARATVLAPRRPKTVAGPLRCGRESGDA